MAWKWDPVNKTYYEVAGPNDATAPPADGDDFSFLGNGNGNEEIVTPFSDIEDINKATGVDELSLFDEVTAEMQRLLRQWGEENGEATNVMDAFLFSNQSLVNETIQNSLVAGGKVDKVLNLFGGVLGTPDSNLQAQMLSSVDGINYLVQEVWSALGQKAALGDIPTAKKTGGTGSRRATPAEIRNRFDVDQLTRSATDIWRARLLQEPENARVMAQAYIEAVVASRGEKVIDFQTFIEKRAETTPRHASIYKDKPPSMSHAQFLQPYFQAAQQVTRPGNAANVAIGGAQFGADAQTFSSRLARTEENQASSGFIGGLERRLTNLKGVFKE